MTRRPRDITLTIVNVSLTSSSSGSYGLHLGGKPPAMVAKLQDGSPAKQAGLQVGDFVLNVANQNTRDLEGEAVLRLLQEQAGRKVAVKVARANPIPVSDSEQRRALLVLQTKLDQGTTFQPAAPSYASAVEDALLSAQELLGDLGLDSAPSQPTHPSAAGGRVQEVEVKMYDSDSLPSPPPSDDEEKEEVDPLLDFSRDDHMTYHVTQPAASAKALAQSVRQTEDALKGIQDLVAGLNKKARQPPIKAEPTLVSSQATFQPPASQMEQNKSPPASQAPVISMQSMPEWQYPAASMATSQPTTRGERVVIGEVQAARKDPTPPSSSSSSSFSPPPSSWKGGGGRERQKREEELVRRRERDRRMVEEEKRREEEERREEKRREEEERREEERRREEEKRREEKRRREERRREEEKRRWKEERRREEEKKREEERRRDQRRGEQREGGEAEVVLRRHGHKSSRAAQKASSPPASFEHVPLRKKKGHDMPAGLEPQGHVGGTFSGFRQLEPTSVPADTSWHTARTSPVQLATPEVACKGLPDSVLDWRREEVCQWLEQLSPTLSQLYLPLFTHHDITGRTLMRLAMTKLKEIGIDDHLHCRQLALEVAKLKIHQESLELSQLQEGNQLSFL